MRGSSSEEGFTIIEIMIVVAILSALAAEQCRFAGKPVDETHLFGPGAYIKAKLACPAGGVYVLPTDESADVECTFADVDPEDKGSWHKLTKQ